MFSDFSPVVYLVMFSDFSPVFERYHAVTGYRLGLKRIEKSLKISRKPDEVELKRGEEGDSEGNKGEKKKKMVKGELQKKVEELGDLRGNLYRRF